MKNCSFQPGKIIYFDPADFAVMSWNANCRCGKPGNRVVNSTVRLCEGCFFRYTVMEAAGRAEEFWEAHKALPDLLDARDWVWYKFNYSVSKPDTTLRIRNISAGESKV